MKNNTTDHPKLHDLADWIDEATAGALSAAGVDPLVVATGLLERLWHWVARYASDGNVSRQSPKRVAQAIGWRGDPAALLEAMVAARLLDRRGELVLVHDWPDHCEDTVHARLARARERFADGSRPKLTKLSGDERREAQEHYDREDGIGSRRNPAPGGAQNPPSAESGARRRNPAPVGGLPGPKPEPEPEPLAGAGRARTREAEPEVQPQPAQPRPACDEHGSAEQQQRDPSRPPDDCDSEEWQLACQCADLLEHPSLDAYCGPVVEPGGTRRALGLVALMALCLDRGKPLAWIHEACEGLFARAALDRDLADCLRKLREKPDWTYPNTRSPNQASALEKAHRLLEQRRGKSLAQSRRARGGGLQQLGALGGLNGVHR